MPSRNVVREHLPNTFYHVYNRGNRKSQIFFNDRDYSKFMSIILFLLTPRQNLANGLKIFSKPRTKDQDFSQTIYLINIILMPNHFHLLLYVKDPKALEKLMHRLSQKFTKLINDNYLLTGRLFQGVYRARPIMSEGDLINTAAYIHLNPNELSPDNSDYYLEYPYSDLTTSHPILEVGNFDLLLNKARINIDEYNEYLSSKSKDFVEKQLIKKIEHQ